MILFKDLRDAAGTLIQQLFANRHSPNACARQKFRDRLRGHCDLKKVSPELSALMPQGI
jgi:hypothetical protein